MAAVMTDVIGCHCHVLNELHIVMAVFQFYQPLYTLSFATDADGTISALVRLWRRGISSGLGERSSESHTD